MSPSPGRRAVDVSIVLPTIGRPELIRACLDSLSRCDPRAGEILVVDSSADGAVADVVAGFASAGARRIYCGAKGLGNAFNLGLSEAVHEAVLLTNDDCTVEPSWVGAGVRHLSENPGVIVTGRVRPRGDAEAVPSTVDDLVARDYSGRAAFVLYTQCMALPRSVVLEFGGFDGRIRPSAEDNDLSYRWLQAGRRIQYQPDFVVWHHDWRSRDQLSRLYVDYGVGQGMVYGKHLRQGDLRVIRFVISALWAAVRAVAARIVRGPRTYPDPRLGFVRGLPIGLARGWNVGRGSEPS
jgi:GT2 family glycosyltransferase